MTKLWKLLKLRKMEEFSVKAYVKGMEASDEAIEAVQAFGSISKLITCI